MSKPNKSQRGPRESNVDVLFAKASEQWDRGRVRSAFRLFLSAAKRGDPSAQHNLAYFYDIGIGVKPNRRAALYWYKRAFRRGYRIAASNIGTMYRDEENTGKALAWFQRAIRLGDADANLEVAKILLRKKGREREAIAYLKRTTKAKPSDVTLGSKQEARRLLPQVAHQLAQSLSSARRRGNPTNDRSK